MATAIPEEIAAQLVPEQVRALILELAQKQLPGAQRTVAVWAIMQQVAARAGLTNGMPPASYLRVQEALQRVVEQLSEIRYVEGG